MGSIPSRLPNSGVAENCGVLVVMFMIHTLAPQLSRMFFQYVLIKHAEQALSIVFLIFTPSDITRNIP